MSYAGEPAPDYEANALTTLQLPRAPADKPAPTWPQWAGAQEAYAQVARQLTPMQVQLVGLWPDEDDN